MTDKFTNDEFADLAKAPERSRTNEGTVTERSIKELIDAQTHLTAQENTGSPFGLRFARGKPGKALG